MLYEIFSQFAREATLRGGFLLGRRGWRGITEANAYFATRINSDTWDTATDANKTKALATAERQLESFKSRVDSTRFYYAIYEQALFLLQLTAYDLDRQKAQALGIVGGSVGSANEYSSAEIVGRKMGGITICPDALSHLRGPGIKAGGMR